jgi:hypothetical protein
MAAATAKVITFERAAKAYLINRKSEWKSAVHLAQWERSVADLINPVIGKLPVGEITTADVRRVLDPIWNTTRETASRVRGRIEVILASAGRRQNNPAAWRGNLEFELPKRNRRAMWSICPHCHSRSCRRSCNNCERSTVSLRGRSNF